MHYRIMDALKRKDKIPLNEIVTDIVTKCGTDRKSVAIRIDALMRSGAPSNPSLVCLLILIRMNIIQQNLL